MEEEKQKNTTEKAITVFLIIGLIFAIFNQFQLLSLKSGNRLPTGMTIAEASIVPAGIPSVYGAELEIRYDDISPNDQKLADKTIDVLANYDRTLTLSGENLERYIDIASQISCEYCCGAQSIIIRREDVQDMDKKIEAAIASGQITKEQAERYRKNAGDAACGCAHSYAMRGLAKYLITEHGSEFTNDEILEEMAKWKSLFFPGQMTAKAQALNERGITFSYANLGSNTYRGIEKGASAGSNMVGGC